MPGINRKRWIAGGIIAIVLLAGAAGIAVATGAGDDDQPLTGETLQRATQAALDYTGGGTVTETEAGDDGAAYGVEVRMADGSQVEVNLDADFKVIGQEADDDGLNDDDSDDDDD